MPETEEGSGRSETAIGILSRGDPRTLSLLAPLSLFELLPLLEGAEFQTSAPGQQMVMVSSKELKASNNA